MGVCTGGALSVNPCSHATSQRCIAIHLWACASPHAPLIGYPVRLLTSSEFGGLHSCSPSTRPVLALTMRFLVPAPWSLQARSFRCNTDDGWHGGATPAGPRSGAVARPCAAAAGRGLAGPGQGGRPGEPIVTRRHTVPLVGVAPETASLQCPWGGDEKAHG